MRVPVVVSVLVVVLVMVLGKIKVGMLLGVIAEDGAVCCT